MKRREPAVHEFTVDELRRMQKLSWEDGAMLLANQTATNEVQVNDFTGPILERLSGTVLKQTEGTT